MIENNDNPFIERPDEHEVGDELYCWMPGNSDRECNGGCVAYDASYQQDQVRDSCKVLNCVRSATKSFIFLSDSLQRQEKALKAFEEGRTKAAERAELKAHIESLPKPPEVRK